MVDLIVISADCQTQIRELAQQSYPLECCGILVGRIGREQRIVERVVGASNEFDPAERTRRYLVSADELLKVSRDAERGGLTVIGFFHTHPDHPAEPSEYDRLNAWPFYSYLIVSVEKSIATVSRSWQYMESTSRFVEQTVLDSPR